MTKVQKTATRWAVASLLGVTILLSGVMFHALAPVSGEAQPSGPERAYLKYAINNKTGTEVCGLNLRFEGLEVPASQALQQISPFTRITPTSEHNQVTLGGSCVQPDGQVTLRFVPGVGMGATLYSYSWIKTGKGLTDLIIPGSFDGVFQEVVTPSAPVAVFAPQEEHTATLPLTTFSFELAATPRGQLLVAQGMVIYEGQPVGVYDVEKQRQLSQKLDNLGLFDNRRQIAAQLDALTIYSPFSGQVKHVAVETVERTTRVTLELASLDALEEVTATPINTP